MNERRKIEERLRKKEHEINDLEAQVRNARIYVQALQDVLKMLPRPVEPAATSGTLRPGSNMAKVRDFILQHGRPVHISELLKGLGLPASRESRASLSGSLAAYVRKGEIFTRPAPNTFGLIELGHTREPAEKSLEEPPADFADEKSATSELPDDLPF